MLGFIFGLPKKANPQQILLWHRALFFLFFYDLYLVIYMGNRIVESPLRYLAYLALVFGVFHCKFSLRPIPSLWNKFAFLIAFLGGCASLFLAEPTLVLQVVLALSVIFGNIFSDKPQPLRLVSALTYGFVGAYLPLVLPSLPIMFVCNCLILMVIKFRILYLSFSILPKKEKNSIKRKEKDL